MLDSEDPRLFRHQIRHSRSQVASATANVKHIFSHFELLGEVLKSIGMHVWGGYSSPIANRLRGVDVGKAGGVVLAVYSFHGFGYVHILDDSLVDEGFYEILISFVHPEIQYNSKKPQQALLQTFPPKYPKQYKKPQDSVGSGLSRPLSKIANAASGLPCRRKKEKTRLSAYRLVILDNHHRQQYPHTRKFVVSKLKIQYLFISVTISLQQSKLLQMQLSQPRNLIVATLNYCGIMNNPFEFYCAEYQRQLEAMSEIFVSLIPQYLPSFSKDKFSWQMGKIDQKVRVGRYSPAFDPDVGIVNGRFITKHDFELRWDDTFRNLPITKELNFTDDERNSTRLYDFLLYHTLLAFAYKNQPFQQLIKNTPDKYRATLQPFYQLSFLSQERKLQKIMAALANIQADIFFIQEYSPLFQEAVERTGQYYTVSDLTKDTLIIAKRLTFKIKYPTSSILSAGELRSLNWAERTSVAVLDKCILINAHLNSKLEKSKEQIEEMKKALVEIKRAHPKHSIIVGGDLNSYLDGDKTFQQYFNFYPHNESQITTAKKRTMMQGQFHKGNKLVVESKDKIISSLPILNASVRYINKEIANSSSLIPSDHHPFDHFIVLAQLQRA